MHLRVVSVDKKIRAISVAFIDSLFARILIPNYLIFSRFYQKNRTTTKPTSKSLFNDFNARRGIATYNCNSMVNDGNSSPGQARAKHLSAFAPRHRERTFGQHLHARQRLFLRHNTLTLYQAYYSITYEHLFVKHFWDTF